MKKILSFIMTAIMVFGVVIADPVKVKAAAYIEAIPLIYDEAGFFCDGMVGVGINGKYGFVDKTGKEVLPFIYEYADEFQEGLACVKMDGKWGVIDETGEIIAPFKYDSIFDYSEGMAVAELDGKRGFIDKTGKEVMTLEYDDVYGFKENLAPVMLDGKWGFINKAGVEVVPLKYDSVKSFRDGMAPVMKDDLWGYIDPTGKEVITIQYEWANNFYEGTASVGSDQFGREGGYIDKTGDIFLAVEDFEQNEGNWYLWNFRQGLAAVIFDDDNYCLINLKGEVVAQMKYDDGGIFSGGFAPVSLNGKWGFIDRTGKEVVPLKYDEIGDFNEGMAAVKLNGKWGFITLETQAAAASDAISMTLNGKPVTAEVPPFIANGRTMVPVRFISEALGAKVDWDAADRVVTVTKGATVITLTIGSDKMFVDGTAVVMDVPAQIVNGRTFVPVRYVAEALGLTVGWDADTRTVVFTRD